MNSTRFLFFALCSLLTAFTAQAQFEIDGGAENLLDARRAGASANVSGGEVSAITVWSGGGLYQVTAPPAVVLSSPQGGGTTARAVAVVSPAGVVTAINVTDPGSGYGATPPAVYIAPPETPGGPVATTPQFAGRGATSASAAAVGITSDKAVYPAARDITVPAAPVVTIVLQEAAFGYSFSSGVPLYFMGDEIRRPFVYWDGSPSLEGQAYWRSEPVRPGESFDGAYLENLGVGATQPLRPQGTVTVTASSTGSSTVIVSSLPSGLTAGANLLGQRVNLVSGNTITLAGNANRTITAPESAPFSRYQPYYYSPHANKVFASQPGRVTITWVSASPDTSAPDELDPTYKFRTETFAVSSASQSRAKTIFWTEKSFKGPLVLIPEGRIARVNPVFNSFIPGMTTEYVPVGSNPNSGTALPAEQRTIWFDNESGLSALHAYNIEGRVFIEYLGSEIAGSTGLHQFLGADIVDIKRVAEIETVRTDLGEKLRPRQESAQNGDDQLLPSVQLNLAQAGQSPYGSHLRPDGVTDYYAERENLDPDNITLYWLETLDAAIHFLPQPSLPGLAINWPKYKRNYLQKWPDAISRYEPVNVRLDGNDIGNGPKFTPANLPQLVFQDDPDNTEARVDAQSQRLVVDFSASADKTNRTLLKFESTSGPWYVRFYIQAEGILGSPEGIDPDGTGPLTGTPAVYTLNDLNADRIADWSPPLIDVLPGDQPAGRTTAIVGQRIERPDSAYEIGGYVSSGRCYSSAAYIDPFTAGVEASAAGGIIPVNALSGNDTLTIWWFKKVVAPNSNFASFYVPAIAAQYHVSYPDSPTELVIASGKGVEGPSLTSEQKAGSIYVQNDSAKIGYNPNEEHALMLDGNAYALRNDLNLATSSEPFVMIQYNEPLTGRPAMRAVKVITSNITYPLSYDKIAGTPLQPPLPLTALPLPLKDDGQVKNEEIQDIADNPDAADAPDSYKKFTFVDRKGQHWLYRGAHGTGSPSFGMRYYYYLREGFYFPGKTSQPAVGSIQPFIKDTGDGVAETLTYFPKWPDDPSLAVPKPLGVLQTAETLTLPKDGLPQVRGQSSAQVIYQQSIAKAGKAKNAVLLQDPTRQKTYLFGKADGLAKLPSSIPTTDYAGRTYFQRLPPHLQSRFYFDPNQGSKGGLVLIGEFVDVPVGEDYLNLNAVSLADLDILKAVCSTDDTANRPLWEKAVEGLSTSVETFRKYKVAKASAVVARTAAATAEMSPVTVLLGGEYVHVKDKVSSVSVTDSGQGYLSAPAVTFAGEATGAATLANDKVSGISVTGQGSYQIGQVPAVSIAAPSRAGQIISISVGAGGSGYTLPPDISIAPPEGGGVRATARCVLSNGAVSSIVILSSGSGYDPKKLPAISISPPSVQYAVDSASSVKVGDISEISDPDTAVDSYALSATGSGTGYVTLVFGNGEVFTDVGDPVTMNIIKVSPDLYKGDVKALLSSNPLDEQVTLRHSGDYGARPENFEFEWRYAFGATNPPVTGLTAAGAALLGVTMESFTISGGTTQYSTAPTVVISGGGGSGASAITSMGLSADSFTILPGTTVYSVAPDVTIAGGNGTGATATATLDTNGNVISISVTQPGSGFSSAPTLIFSGGNITTPGTNPAGIGNASNFVVAGITNLNPGIGFTTAPSMTFADGIVTSAKIDPAGSGNAAHFLVSAISVINPGSLYSGAPNVIISGGGGAGAAAVAILSTASVGSVTVISGGVDYTSPPAVTFPAPPPQIDPASSTTNWNKPNGTLGSSVLVGGSDASVIKTPAILMGDTWFAMTYRKKAAGADPAGEWSEWTTPVLVEGWVKRVLAKITPFNQRMENLYSTSVNTDVSLLTQAGHRWEGDIALNLENVNDAGLIEIYETVLNRAKSFTTDSGIDFESSNRALILAAGYLSDLYTILGNEAYADAANPTISIDDQTTVTEVNTSRFSFEGQVASSLDEELALLRGRDDFGLPSTGLAPAYNRLFWNYTRGINGGEVIYAVNYNIKEKAGSSSADGKVDAADALRMFPQGHGDAYGHYLTALTGYYKLLTHPDFTWTVSAEAVTVLGQAVLVDYKDERKFAAAAGNLARTAQQVFHLVQRQSYNDDPASGWSHFQDGKLNPQTGVIRRQGLDETASRAAQGSFYHWITGNALLPDKDGDTNHTGVQIVDRTTVPELNELVTAADSFQSGMDLANAHLNPLGLSPDAIAFDISPAEHKAGNSHYEQINARALRAVLNAKGSFDQAAKMTRLLRNQENQISDRQSAIEDQEMAYVAQLEELYGKPYAGDIGPGKTYAQGYSGPDTLRWFIIDRPTDLVDTTKPVTVKLRVPTQVRGFTGQAIDDIVSSYNGGDTTEKTFDILPHQTAQFSQTIDASGSLGRRPQTGQLQESLMEGYVAQVAVLEAAQDLQARQIQFTRDIELFRALVGAHAASEDTKDLNNVQITALQTSADVLSALATAASLSALKVAEFIEAGIQGFPTVVGLANDPSSVPRAVTKTTGITATTFLRIAGASAKTGVIALENTMGALGRDLDIDLQKIGFNQEELQAAYEFQRSYYDLIQQHYRLATLAAEYQTATQKVANLSASGQRLLTERESFRQRAAAIITGFRTKDLTFRTFRNEALEQYRTLFDLASRYTFLAAKSYDYETGLLGTPEGNAVINRIVSSRALGDLTGGVPQATVSTLGDAGLAGTMAQLNADFSVAEGRLGINNPDSQGTLFSLRRELYRILDDPARTNDDEAWQQALEQAISPDLLADPDVAKHCNNLRKPDGTPVPGIVIPFGTTIQHGMNFFGLPLAVSDHAYTPSSYSTKISSVGVVVKGYVGMDPYAFGTPNAGDPASNDPDGLSATPYVYLIPCGNDFMLAPPLGDTNTLRSWTVHDQALPLPYNLGANSFNTTQFFTAAGTLSEQPWILRKHQAFRPVNDPAFFYSTIPAEFTNSRLIGRSVWNSQWKIVIPAYTMLSDEQDALNRFVRSVGDIQLFLRTYSHSGN